jgi:2-dehydropantoate 2-reductase
VRIAVIGAGAMGSLFGARLALAGEEVALVDVNAAHVAAIRAQGLRLDDDHGTRVARPQAGLAADFAGPFDLVLLFTKGPHSVAAMTDARHLVGPDTRVLTLQNGLGAAERILSVMPDARVAVGMTDWPADLGGPGRVSSHGAGKVRLWSHDGAPDPGLDAVAAALDAAGMDARADAAVMVAIWEKVLFNAVMNPVAALTRQTVGGMGAHPDMPALAEAILAEGFAVAQAEGVGIDPVRVRGMIAFAWREHGPHRPSMLIDVMAGRPTEIDSIAGALAERSRAHGLATPVLDTLCGLVRMIAPA